MGNQTSKIGKDWCSSCHELLLSGYSKLIYTNKCELQSSMFTKLFPLLVLNEEDVAVRMYLSTKIFVGTKNIVIFVMYKTLENFCLHKNL